MRLQRVPPAEGTHLDLKKWEKVKLDFLEGAFQSSPGCLVGHTRFRVEKQDFTRASSMQVKYTFYENTKMFLVHKDKWSRTELDDITTDSFYYQINTLWMLPNMDKVPSLNEAENIYQFLCGLYHLTCDSEHLDKGELETIGCVYDEEMTWTKPSPQRADLVVENLKKLCSELEIELQEV